MRNVRYAETITTFASDLGWFAMVAYDDRLSQIAFGHPTKESALAALDPARLENARFATWNRQLVRHLQNYAKGIVTDFLDVPIDLGHQTEFQQEVSQRCRRVPYGQTISYGRLAAEIGRPRAARAVGQCMASNRIPLVIPCHRIVGSDHRLGGFSAPGGLDTKRRLLELEQMGLARG